MRTSEKAGVAESRGRQGKGTAMMDTLSDEMHWSVFLSPTYILVGSL